jgi:hypothetical protein
MTFSLRTGLYLLSALTAPHSAIGYVPDVQPERLDKPFCPDELLETIKAIL